MMVSHDAFARESLIREKRRVYSETCSWCGQVHEDKRGKYLYAYGTERDDNYRQSFAKGLYCSISCFRSDHS